MNDFLDNLANDQYRKMMEKKLEQRQKETAEELERREKEIDMMFGSEYESGIDYDSEV